MTDILILQERLGCHFKNPELLVLALTHKSYSRENPDRVHGDNERLEFLGDTVLNFIISEALFLKNEGLNEGGLSKRRAAVVSRPALASVAKKIGLGDFMLFGIGEEKCLGKEKPSLLGNALEAVIGAIYLDRGFRTVRKFVLDLFSDMIAEIASPLLDYKSQLQELSQKDFTALPAYHRVEESGPEHQRQFEMEVKIRGVSYGRGFGKSKKAAEQESAFYALQRLTIKKEGG
jgi:ribonuclease-3